MNKFINILYSCTIATLLSLFLAGCEDYTFSDYGMPDIGEGEAQVTATVSFNAFTDVRLSSRATAGDAIKEIESLYILVYDTGDKLLYKWDKDELKDYKYDPKGNTGWVNPDGDTPNDGQAESSTPSASFKFPTALEYGTYKIFAVANVDDKYLTEEAIASPDNLKNITVDWDEDNIPSNNQMMGVFDIKSDNVIGEGSVTINSETEHLHAWLVRCASKVTVSFNTDELNDRTWIYLRRVVIKDIMPTCNLNPNGGNSGNANTELIDEGESYWYAPENDAYPHFESWPTLSKGTSSYGSAHGEADMSLYFYENNQGEGKDKSQIVDEDHKDVQKEDPEVATKPTYPDGINTADKNWKDAKPYGTYIEVEAYYRSYAKGNEGEGKIYYRFMLGMDTFKDYNARRNHHFKLTLNFRGNANDVDWHIEYENNSSEVIYTPQPFYISYSYGEEVSMPVTINGKIKEGTKIVAEIVRNDWQPLNAPASEYWAGQVWTGTPYQHDGVWNGFLSLRPTNLHKDYVGRGISGAVDSGYLLSYWYGGSQNMPSNIQDAVGWGYRNKFSIEEVKNIEGVKVPQQGYREYLTTNRNGVTRDTDDPYHTDEYEIVEVKNGANTTTHVYIPLYTRALFLVKEIGYSGANANFFYQRKAQVNISVTLDDGTPSGKKVNKLCDVIQVRRLINPCGVYRDFGDNKPFHVVLNWRNSQTASTFAPFTSEGRWSAEIEAGDPNFINLNGRNKIEGSTGSEVDFTINFVPTTSKAKNRYAVILIKYHDYTCVHRIVVRQGDLADNLVDGGSRWHAYNLRGGNKECTSYIEPGSLFRWDFLKYGIDASENISANIGLPPSGNMTVVNEDGTLGKATWNEISFTQNNYKDAAPSSTAPGNCLFNKDIEIKGVTSKFANYEDWTSLRDNDDIGFIFGVCYDGNTTMTSMASDDAFSYRWTNESNEGKGMRGTFAYNRKTGKNIFFPAGEAAIGFRKHGTSFANEDDPGTLRYAMRSGYMPAETVYKLPPFWRIKDNFGAIYWAYPDRLSRTDVWNKKTDDCFCAWDMNISTYDFNVFNPDNIFGSNVKNDGPTRSGAAYIRLVDK